MANINQSIRRLLQNYNVITDVVSSRVYTLNRPQTLPQLPCIIIQRITTTPNNTKQENSTIDNCVIQLTFIGVYTMMIELADNARGILDNYVGTPVGSTEIQECTFAGQSEQGELDYMKADTVVFDGVQTIVQEYNVRYFTGY